ncbi:MAG: nucleotidyl transferase AbiEii/AbiGii toxin family protein [Planctomycetota bacterium]
MNIKAELFSVLDALDAEGIPYALCGGLALAVHGCPRFTKDIDLLVQEKDMRRLEATVRRLGFDVPSGWIVFGRGTAREQRLYRIVKAEDDRHLALDLVMVTETQRRNWDTRQTLDLGDRRIVAVSREGLIRMKRNTGRTQDQADVEGLEGSSDD